MEKLIGEQRSLTNSAVATVISDIRNAEGTFGMPILPTSIDVTDDAEAVIVNDTSNICRENERDCVIANEHEIKAEPVDDITHRKIAFSVAENEKLKEGIVKFGRSQWSRILEFGAGTFHKVRTRDSLRMRANTIGFKRTYKC